MPAESQSSPEADWSTVWWGRGMVCGATGHVGGPGLTGVSVAELSCERCTVDGAVRAPPSPVWADASSAVGVPSAATASAVATAVGMGRVVRMTLLVVVGDPGLPVEWRHRPARRSPAAHRRPLRAHSGELGRRLHMRHALVYGLSGGGGVFFRLLGPLEVADEARPVQFGEGRQRVVLVLLLLHRNEPISSDRLIDALWGESPPPTAAKVLQNYVGRLRRSLGDREGHRLQTHGRGYALRVEDGELDVDRFERLLREGGDALAGGRPADAARLLREALALWRGPALADVAYEAFAQPEIARLEEQRTVALERRIDADLALGRHADLVAELEALVARYPLREHLRGQRMLALYRCGRQAEALAAFRDARRLLVEEVGVEARRRAARAARGDPAPGRHARARARRPAARAGRRGAPGAARAPPRARVAPRALGARPARIRSPGRGDRRGRDGQDAPRGGALGRGPSRRLRRAVRRGC